MHNLNRPETMARLAHRIHTSLNHLQALFAEDNLPKLTSEIWDTRRSLCVGLIEYDALVLEYLSQAPPTTAPTPPETSDAS